MKMHGLAAWAWLWCGVWAGGCCAPTYCGDCGPRDIIAAAPCAPCDTGACGPGACGPGACGPGACGPGACGPSENFSPQCVACGVNGPCPKHVGGRGLFNFLYDNATCGAGCGEFYVHPWINDPPHPHDPCDHHGHWIGPHHRCTPACRVSGCPVGIHNLWGHRSDLGGCCGGTHALADPMHGEVLHDGAIIHDGAVLSEGAILHGPTLAEPPTLTPPQDGRGVSPPDDPPTPPEFPGPAGAPKSRSALKKIDGRPAVYYRRPHATTTR